MVLACCLPLLLFAAMDRRFPNDHDIFYTTGLTDVVWRMQHAESLGAWLTPLVERTTIGAHPPLGQLVLLLWIAVFGASRAAFVTANLPFVLALAIGTFGVARRFLEERGALVVTWAMATLPFLLCYGRKREPFFHLAALVPLGLWAALVIVEDARTGRARWGPWLAFAGVELARVYTHHIVLADVAITTVVVCVLALRSAADRPDVLRRVGATAGLLLVGASWSLGLGEALGIASEWSFPRYWRWRAHYLQGELDRPYSTALEMIVGQSWRWHLMPGALLWWLLPGLGAAAAWWRSAEARPALAMLFGPALLQLPLMWHVVANGGAPVDWGMLVIGPLMGGAVALAAVLPPARTRLWQGGLVLIGLWTAGAPLLAGAVGPDPLVDRTAYTTGPLAGFTLIDTGHDAARHIPSRAPDPLGSLLAELDDPGEVVVFDGHELWLDESSNCTWTDEIRLRFKLSSNWPALAHGIRHVDSTPEAGEPTVGAVALLLYEPMNRAQDQLEAGQGDHLGAALSCIEDARVQFAASLGRPVEEVRLVDDPRQALRTMEWYEPSPYLRQALVWMRPSGS